MKKVIKLTENDLMVIVRRVIKEQEVRENRLDYEKMSDEELHNLHPYVKKNSKHFNNFEPTPEFLRWYSEVQNRNIYKRFGKFHNSFDKEEKIKRNGD